MIATRIAVSVAVISLGYGGYSQPAQAGSKFYCASSSGAPATMTTTRRGKQVPIILWKSSAFSADGWSPERRCEEVSQRFNSLHQSGALKFLTTGRINGMPVICAARAEGDGCAEGGLLYTLKPGQNAGQTLRNLLAVRTKATGPLTETTSRPYISLESIEAASEAQDEAPSAQAQQAEPAAMGSRSSATAAAAASQATAAPTVAQPASTHAGADSLW